MGYDTKFSGAFKLNKTIDERTFEIIEEIRDSRHDERVIPSIWCHWRVGDDGRSIEWDEGEKFYEFEKLRKAMFSTKRRGTIETEPI